MPKLVLVPLALVAAVVAVSAALAVDGSAPVTAYGAVLAPAGKNPAGGIFSALVADNGSSRSIAWTLRFAHLGGKAAAAAIHLGTGSNAPVALKLCGPCTSGASGQAPLPAKLADALSGGGAYVQIGTARVPGALRGVLAPSHALATGLGADQETTKPTAPAGAKGSFTAIVVDTSPRPTIAWTLGFGGLSGAVSSTHVGLGKAGDAGQDALTLCGPCRSGVQGHEAIDPQLATALESGGAFVNVVTQANASGELRGQLQPATQGVAAFQTTLGTALVDDRGRTLYMWEADAGGKSVCYGRCATVWPPALAIGPAVAAGGARSSLLKVTHRTDGTAMLAYNGFPLYGFFRDAAPGDTKGEGVNGFGALWWAVTPDGAKITK